MEAAGIGDPLLEASIQYILNVALTLPAIIYVDKWGRRPSLLYGSLLMMVLMFIVGTLEAIYGEPFHTDNGPLAAISWILQNNDSVSRAVVACSYLFVCTFAVTWVRLRPPPRFTTPHLPLTNTRALYPGHTPRKSSPPRSAPKVYRSRPPRTGAGTPPSRSRRPRCSGP